MISFCRSVISLFLLVSFFSVSVNAETKIAHDFNKLAFKNYDWQLKSEGGYWGTLYSGTLSESEIHFRNKYGGEGYENSGAYFWNAPKGHIIVGVEFRGEVAGYLNSFNAAVFTTINTDLSFEAFNVEWSNSSTVPGPWHTSDVSLEFDRVRGLKSIGFGFEDVQSDATHQVRFSDIVIYTVPDVEILANIYRHSVNRNTMGDVNEWDMIHSGSYANILYSATFANNKLTIKNSYGGETYSNRCGKKWTAPDHEVITRVTFYGEVAGYLKQFNAALFSSSNPDASLDSYDIKWSKYPSYAGPWHGEKVSVDFLPQENVKAVVFGLFDTYSDATHQARFSNIVVETQSLSNATFDYSDGVILHSGDWHLKKGGNHWNTFYSVSANVNELHFKNKHGGENYPNYGAFFWNAPEKSVITGVRFKGEVAGSVKNFKAIFSTSDDPTKGIGQYDNRWSKTSDGATTWNSENVYYTFKASNEVKSIALGFMDVNSNNTNQVRFSNITIITSPAEPISSVTRGYDIIRSTDFKIDSYVDVPPKYSLDLNTYLSIGLNAINFRLGQNQSCLYGSYWDDASAKTIGAAHNRNLPWTWFHNYHGGDYSKIIDRADELMNEYGSTAHGFCIGDEYYFKDLVTDGYYTYHHNYDVINPSITPLGNVFPESDTLAQLGKLLNSVRSIAPDKLVYTVSAPMFMKYNEDNDYKEFLDRVIKNSRPDVLNYDHYPFDNSGVNDAYFKNLALLRTKAIEFGIPYTAWIQACSIADGRHAPSESELRFQAFVSLSYGYTGLSYWTYHSVEDYHTSAILKNVGLDPSHIGLNIKKILPEVKNVGNELINMNSESVFYVKPGSGYKPYMTTAWTTLSDTRIVNISTSAYEKGFVLGFFNKDADNSKYLMVVNGLCLEDKNANETVQSITIKFKSNINSLQRLNRYTGNWETIKLENNTLNNYSLPGGTGDLFRLPY